MANWAEYMLFGSDIFVHLLCAIFCAWAGGRNGWHVCHVMSPEEAEPAGKPQGFTSLPILLTCTSVLLWVTDAFYSQSVLIFGLISAHTCSPLKFDHCPPHC